MTQTHGAFVDFGELAAQVQAEENQIGPAELAVWGGRCMESAALNLVNTWPNHKIGLHYRIWESVNRITFVDALHPLPTEATWLERARLFGPGGDLTLRRDKDLFRWHFVGPAGVVPPNGFEKESLWRHEPEGTTFYQRTASVLLWGERLERNPFWYEDRVAQAKLMYPIDTTGRLKLHYKAYSRAGHVELIWLTKLESYDG